VAWNSVSAVGIAGSPSHVWTAVIVAHSPTWPKTTVQRKAAVSVAGTDPPVGSERLSQCYREGAVTEKVKPLFRAVGVEGLVTVKRRGGQRPDKQDDPDSQDPSPARARYRLLR